MTRKHGPVAATLVARCTRLRSHPDEWEIQVHGTGAPVRAMTPRDGLAAHVERTVAAHREANGDGHRYTGRLILIDAYSPETVMVWARLTSQFAGSNR